MVDDGPLLYYKLTNEPKDSGELKKVECLPTLKPHEKKREVKKNIADLPTLFQNKGEIGRETIF